MLTFPYLGARWLCTGISRLKIASIVPFGFETLLQHFWKLLQWPQRRCQLSDWRLDINILWLSSFLTNEKCSRLGCGVVEPGRGSHYILFSINIPSLSKHGLRLTMTTAAAAHWIFLQGSKNIFPYISINTPPRRKHGVQLSDLCWKEWVQMSSSESGETGNLREKSPFSRE